jgi:hypothetical protein
VHNLLLLLRCRSIAASSQRLLCVHHLHALRWRTLHILHLRLLLLLLLRRRWQALNMLLLCRRRALHILHLLLLGRGSSTAISIHHLPRHRCSSTTRGSRQRSHTRMLHLLLKRWLLLLLLHTRRGIPTCI